MQLPSSTPVSDSGLAALPLPAPLSSVSGEIPSGIRSESSGGFESLIAQLAPSATPRPPVPVAGRVAAQPSLRAASGDQQSGFFLPVSESTPRGLGAGASFFSPGAPAAESTAESELPELTTRPDESHSSTELPTARPLPDLALLPLEALPPLVFAPCEKKPEVKDQETAVSPEGMGDPTPVGSLVAGEASARAKRGTYLKSGDQTVICGQTTGQKDTIQELANPTKSAEFPSADRKPGIAARDTKPAGGVRSGIVADLERTGDARRETPSAAGATDGSIELTDRARAVGAIETAQRGAAGSVAQGVPFVGSDKPNPGNSPENRLPLRAVRAVAAKFAAMETDVKLQDKTAQDDRIKTFLDTDKENVTDHDKSLGTAIAKLEAAMVSRFTSSSQPHPGSEYTGERVSASGAAGETRPEMSSAEPVLSTASEAVEAVLQAADRITSREQRSVNLSFFVGDAQLAVRVELHGEEVRTSFQTDSPELQAALAEEWGARAAGAGDTILRFAAPSITGSNTSSANEFSERSSQQQHERGRSDFHPEFMRQERPRAEPVLVPMPPVTPNSSLTSHRLLSFA